MSTYAGDKNALNNSIIQKLIISKFGSGHFFGDAQLHNYIQNKYQN